MATIGTSVTLLDIAKRVEGDDGKIAVIVEQMMETNEIIEDMIVIESNQKMFHKTTIRTGLPTATWRKLNYGVVKSKSLTKQITDTLGMLEVYAEVDKDLVDMASNKADFRFSEDMAFIQAMNIEMAETMFYGDIDSDKEKFEGLSSRFNSLSAGTAENILVGGGSGSDNTSVWLVIWGPQTVHALYPQGSKAGLQITDKGQVTLEDADGGLYEGYRTHYKWNIGLTVRDWRYVVRICNIDVSALTKTGSTGADLIDLMTQAEELPPSLGMGTPVFYCNKKVRSFLRRQINNKTVYQLSAERVGGKMVVAFDDIPVRRCDQILLTEATIS